MNDAWHDTAKPVLGYGKRDFTAVYWQLPAAKVLFYNGEANFRSSV